VTFANPAGNAAAAAPAYVRALLDLLGEREPIAVMEELVPALERRLRGVPDPVLRRPESPGKWSVVEVLQHLADVELVYGFRGRLVLSEERPTIVGFDQDRWASLFRYHEASPERALEQLRVLRSANLALWRRLGPEERGRIGLHTERGEESMELMLKLMAAHDLVHRRQIDRVLGTA
jgi:DinB family protein